MERDENRIHEIQELIEDCSKPLMDIDDLDWYIDTEAAAEKVYRWIMENMNRKKAVEEFRDVLIDYASTHGGYHQAVDAEDIKCVFDSMYPPEKPEPPEYRVSYFSYKEGFSDYFDEVVQAESVEEAIEEIKDRCYRNYSTCEIKSVIKLS